MLTEKEQKLLVRIAEKALKKGMSLAHLVDYYRECADFLEFANLESYNH